MHLAKCIHRLASQQFHVAPFRDVCPDTKHTSASGFQFRLCLGKMNLIDIGKDYLHPLTHAPLGNPASNAARPTRNHRDLSSEVLHPVLLPVLQFKLPILSHQKPFSENRATLLPRWIL
jgi:hypothetical protein